MKQTATIRLGIQSAPLSPAIHIGVLSDDGTHFTEKVDMTNATLRAVGQFVSNHHAGNLLGLIEMPDGKTVAMNILMSEPYEKGHGPTPIEAGQGDQAVQDPS
jgi:hypothetical protein